MKKVIEDLAVKVNLETAYSGSVRIMFIKGEHNKDFIARIHEQYPKLAFELKAVDTFEKSVEERIKGSLKVFSGNTVDKEVAANVVDKAMNTVFGTVDEVQSVILTEEDKESLEAEILSEESEQERKLRIRAELDIYLIENPIDKSKKGFFVPIAEKFDVTSDYVRKRYNSLKERNLIKENA
jgi:hypothetical protein